MRLTPEIVTAMQGLALEERALLGEVLANPAAKTALAFADETGGYRAAARFDAMRIATPKATSPTSTRTTPRGA